MEWRGVLKVLSHHVFCMETIYTLNTGNNMNNLNNNPFSLNTEAPAEALVRIALAKEGNYDKFGGKVWHKQRADGNYAILGTIVESANLKFKGRPLDSSRLVDTSVEVRVSAEDMSDFLEALEDMDTRIVEIKLLVTADLTCKKLTLRSGETANSVYLFGNITGVRRAASTLTSDELSEDELHNFLAENQAKNRAGRDAYRAAQQMANSSIQEEQSANALA